MSDAGRVTEAAIQREIMNTVGSHPAIRLWRQNTGRAIPIWALDRLVGQRLDAKAIRSLPRIAFGLNGCADLSGIIRGSGKRLEIEVKTATGRQSKHQKWFQTMIERQNGIYILARSVGDVFDRLKDEGLYRV